MIVSVLRLSLSFLADWTISEFLRNTMVLNISYCLLELRLMWILNFGWIDCIIGFCAAVMLLVVICSLPVNVLSPLRCHTTGTAKLYWRFSAALLSIYLVWLLCFWCCESDTHPLPICYNSHWIPVYLSKETKERPAAFPGDQPWCFYRVFMLWLAETTGGRGWSNASLNIIIITLKDLHWPKHGSHFGLSTIDGLERPLSTIYLPRWGFFDCWSINTDRISTVGQNII